MIITSLNYACKTYKLKSNYCYLIYYKYFIIIVYGPTPCSNNCIYSIPYSFMFMMIFKYLFG
jgi:hypothetical protein